MRSALMVGGCVADVALALHESTTPESTWLFAGVTLALAGFGCISLARTLSRKLTGLELPPKRD